MFLQYLHLHKFIKSLENKVHGLQKSEMKIPKLKKNFVATTASVFPLSSVPDYIGSVLLDHLYLSLLNSRVCLDLK